MAFLDLGLSVLWAHCNLGTDSEPNYGEFFTLEEALDYMKQNSIEGRIPTEEEWNELMNQSKCEFHSTGVAIFNRNEESVLIPAAGLCTEDGSRVNSKVVYCYGTSSIENGRMKTPFARYVDSSLGPQKLKTTVDLTKRVSFRLVKDK